MVFAALASVQRFASHINGLSVAIDDVNRRQVYFVSALKAGGRIAVPKVERGELNTKPMAILLRQKSRTGSQTDIPGDSEGCLSGSKQENTELAASDLFISLILQNNGCIDLIESMRMLEEPSQPETKTVGSCSCSNSVRSMPTCQDVASASRNVVGDVRRQEGSTNSRSDVYMRAKIMVT